MDRARPTSEAAGDAWLRASEGPIKHNSFGICTYKILARNAFAIRTCATKDLNRRLCI